MSVFHSIFRLFFISLGLILPILAYGEDLECRVISAAFDFHLASAERGFPCGADSVTGETICLRSATRDTVLFPKKIKLSYVPSAEIDLKLVPVGKFSNTTLSQYKSIYQATAFEASVLSAMESRDKWNDVFGKYDPSDVSTRLKTPTDYKAIQMERRLKFLLNRPESTDAEIETLEADLKAHKGRWNTTLARPREALEQEIAATKQTLFDMAKSQLEDNKYWRPSGGGQTTSGPVSMKPEVNRSGIMSSELSCGSAITPRSHVYIMSEQGLIFSDSGEPVSESLRSYHWHPRSFIPVQILFSSDKTKVLLFASGHDGQHVIRLGGPPRAYLLELLNGEWTVLAATGEGPIIY